MKTSTNQFDIVIIGGSFSGLISALSIAKSCPHFKIGLLEKSDIINQDKPRDGRAFAISRSSLKLFETIDILEEIKPVSGIISDIKIADGNSPFYLNFHSDDSLEKGAESESNNFFGIVTESFCVHKALRNKTILENNIEIICPNFYQDIIFENNQAEITLDNQRKITAKLVLACDGKFSNLRTKFNIKTFQKSYQQTALVFNISHSQPHQNIALEKFLPDGPFAVLPMKNPLHSSIVWTLKSKNAEAILLMDQENFSHQLNKSLNGYLGDTQLIDKAFSYDLNLVAADKFYYQRMVLVSDAAHGIHPIAGQGLNLGISDIKALTSLIKEYDDCGLDIGGETLLQKYSKTRKFETYKMIVATDALNGLFSNNFYILKTLRRTGIGLVEKVSILKNFFIKNAGGK